MTMQDERNCPVCGDKVPPKGRTGPRRRYCSSRCKQEANRPTPEAYDKLLELKRKERATTRANTVKVCAQCGGTFTPKKSLAKKYCSAKCLRRATKYSKTRTCSESGCGRPVATRGLCSAHAHQESRAEGRTKDQDWNPRRQRNYQVRMERLEGAKNGDPAMLRKLIARGDKICPECGDEIDLSIEYPNPFYRTIDHKKPLARGGKHTLSNCQLMHFKCNAAKGVRLSANA